VFSEPVDPRHVEVVGRLVEKQNVPLADEEARKGDSAALTAGQISDSRGDIDVAKKSCKHIANHGGRRPLVLGTFADDDGSDRVVIAEVVVLRQHADLGPAADCHATRIRDERTTDDRHERRLPVAVAADDTDAVPCVNSDCEVVQHDPVRVLVRNAF
jgi:hypothetical protein